MIPLFADDNTYTQEGLDLDRAGAAALGPLVDQWADAGYSLRDMHNILNGVVMDLILSRILFAKETKDGN